ncbi:3'-5' exonuclease [Vibrio parahaemolyticus]|uniref:3'-5' exonuclease n=1 Tax=Vibrio parahaemolyticus TaxID=670 RepID=UPI00235F3295|nr:3'-5' exonuclease [Vibrio parahaemolyticus]HCZ9546619.1 3'-5' exoribonuclease [Vibrio alginolyticus]
MYQNVTIDLETLDTETTAKILSIGIVPWNPGEQVSFQDLCEREASLYIKIDMSSFPAGFTESQSTMNWWNKQGEQARHVLEPNAELDTHIEEALHQVNHHLVKYVQPLQKDGGQIFCRGYDFDGGILENAFEKCLITKPWLYNRFRCIRTVIDTIAGTRNGYVIEKNPEGFIKHHALHDAAKDTMTMLTLMENQ